MRILTIAAAAAFAVGATGTASAASLVNGSFEAGPNPGSFITLGTGSTAITGWTVTGGTIDYIGSYWTAQDGSRSVDLAGSSPGTLSQSFATVAGLGYRVSYWIARNPDGGANPRTGFISAGGSQAQFLYSGSGDRSNMQWQQETFNFVAAGANTTLSFAADPATAGQFFGPALDNVSIAAVPEPATWAFMILGFGLVGGAMRRRLATAKASRMRLTYA